MALSAPAPVDDPLSRLLLLGVSARTVAAGLRDKLFAVEPDQAKLIAALQGLGCDEGLVLATCERVELLVVARPGQRVAAPLLQLIAAALGCAPSALAGQSYCHVGADALRHLLAVAAALESQVLGEPQILGQVKQSVRLAQEAGLAGPYLGAATRAAFAAARRVRRETPLGQQASSMSQVVVAATAFVDRGSSPVGRAVAVATAIVASSPPVNGAVLLPPNEFVVDARTLSVLPLVPAVEGAAADARTRAFAAALERELIAALRSVPGLHLLDAAPVPANAAAELAPSEIGRLLGARGIVQGTLRETPSGPEIELVLLDASTDTLLWENRYRARATDAIAADAIPSIAAAIVATSEDDARAGSARAVNALTSFGEAEGAAE